MPSVWRNEEINELKREIMRLRAANRTNIDIHAEVDRQRAESESRRQDLLLQTEATNHFRTEAYKALDEVKRLRTHLKVAHGCGGDDG